MLNLKDPSLFKQQCYINGEWCDADSGATIEVNNPATGEIIARDGYSRNTPRHRGG
jgi:succinate-semialdehyde dehydrogenase/glutarate-semialdehyde dehydrogenase